MEALAETAPYILGTRWESNQHAFLVGTLTLVIGANGRLFHRKFDASCGQIEGVYNALVQTYLPTRFHIQRRGKALLAKFRKLKIRNKQLGGGLFSQYWSRFLGIVPRSLFLKPIFQFRVELPSEQHLLEILRSTEWDIDPTLPVRLVRRSNTWTVREDCCLIDAVVERFLITGSLFPCRKSRGMSSRGECWKDIALSFYNTTSILGLELPSRPRGALKRRFKFLKQRQPENLIKYFHAFRA